MTHEEILDLLEDGELDLLTNLKMALGKQMCVKKAILEAFKNGTNASYEGIYEGFVDKHNLPPHFLSPKTGFD